VESLEDEKRLLDRQLNDGEIQRKALRAENGAMSDARDAARLLASNMEKDKHHADVLLEEARKLNSGLEGQLAGVENNYMALQGK